MKSIAMIVCLTLMLLSITSGLVSGEVVESNNSRVFVTDHQATTPVAGNLQVNVDNINGYPVANVYVYVDGEERALTSPFGYVHRRCPVRRSPHRYQIQHNES